jgi:hypothetical protein
LQHAKPLLIIDGSLIGDRSCGEEVRVDPSVGVCRSLSLSLSSGGVVVVVAVVVIIVVVLSDVVRWHRERRVKDVGVDVVNDTRRVIQIL